MSDTSQGEGWWLASDGKWYAPQPNMPLPPPLRASAASSYGPQVQWRVTPGGERQYLGDDGNWYVSDQPEPAVHYAAPMPTRAGPAHAAPLASSTVPAGAWLAIIGGLLIGISAFLPWLTATALIDHVSRNGFQLGNNFGFSADGVVCIILGVVTALVGIVRLTNSAIPRFLQRSAIVTGIAAAAVFANRYGDLQDFARNLNGQADVSASVGYGFWLLIVGAAITVVSGLILRSASKSLHGSSMPTSGNADVDTLADLHARGVLTDEQFEARRSALIKDRPAPGSWSPDQQT